MVNRNLNLLACALLLAGAPVTSAAEFEYMYRGGVTHTGDYSAETPLDKGLSLFWYVRSVNKGIHTASKSTPIADDKKVYVGTDDGYLCAFDKNNGRTVWRFKARKSANGIHSSPALDGENVYVGAYDGYLYALDRESGAVRWGRKLGDYIGSSPVLFEDKVYIGAETASPDGYLCAVDRRSGKVIFRTENLSGHTHCTPAVSRELRTVYLGANSGYFFAFNADTGKKLWKFRARKDIKSTAAVAGGLVIFTSWDSYIYALDSRSGALKWKFRTGNKAMSSPAADETEKLVFAGSHDARCYCLDLLTGRKIWDFKTANMVMSSPVIARLAGTEPQANILPKNNGRTEQKAVIVGSNDWKLYLLNERTGQLIRCLQLDGAASSVPYIKDGVLYLSSNRGFFAFR